MVCRSTSKIISSAVNGVEFCSQQWRDYFATLLHQLIFCESVPRRLFRLEHWGTLFLDLRPAYQISFRNGRDLSWPYFISQWAGFAAAIFQFAMGVIYQGHISLRNGRDSDAVSRYTGRGLGGEEAAGRGAGARWNGIKFTPGLLTGVQGPESVYTRDAGIQNNLHTMQKKSRIGLHKRLKH